MNFGGSAPELVNGRLAMLGFIAAVGAELSSGEASISWMTTKPLAHETLTLLTCIEALCCYSSPACIPPAC